VQYIKFKVFNVRKVLYKHHLLLVRKFIFLCAFILVKTCDALTPPNSGVISPPSCLVGSNYSQTCRYTCARPGYVLKGTSTRVCDNNGQWTGSNDTRCRGKETFKPNVARFIDFCFCFVLFFCLLQYYFSILT